MSQKPFIAFDMDGTLLDTRHDIAQAANAARVDLGLPEMSIEEVVKAVGDGVNLFVARVTYPEEHPEFRRARKIFLKYYADYVIGETKPYPGILELLEELHSKGFKMGVVSNKPENLVDQLVKHFSWQKYFSVWLGGDSAEAPKPSAEPLWFALDKAGLPRNHPLVMVGDGHQDVMAAKNAKVPCLWCSWGFNEMPPQNEPVVRVDSCDDVLKFLKLS